MTPVAQVLDLRRRATQGAAKKFYAVIEGMDDDRVKDVFVFSGASRTGRYAARRMQMHNLKRPTMADPGQAADLLLEDPARFRAYYDLEDVGSLIRSVVKAEPGKKLVVADYANIESRVLSVLSNDYPMQLVFSQGRDPYKAFATEWTGVPYDQVDKGLRNLCKPPALGCGYGLGPVGLKTYAKSMAVDLTEAQCESAVRAYRRSYPGVPRYWRALENGWVDALYEGSKGRWEMVGDMLTFRLPGGRRLHYYQPESGDEGLSFMGLDQYTHQWTRIRTYGAKLCENVVQATALDVLQYGMERYTEEGGHIVGHVHDEIIAEEEEDASEVWLEGLIGVMRETPPWLPKLILDAEGYVSDRYRKG